MNDHKIKIPFHGLTYSSFSQIIFWTLMSGFIVFCFMFFSIAIKKGYSFDHILLDFSIFSIIYTFFYFVITIPGNKYFAKYLTISPDEIIYTESILHGSHEKKFSRSNMKSFLWKNVKRSTYGSLNTLYLINSESNKLEVLKNQPVVFLSKSWFEFLDQISVLSGLPIEKEFFVSSFVNDKYCEIENDSISIDNFQKRRRYYKNYLISIALTLILF